ncbi:MAG: pantetheine-phosphate adenylyltransferase [Sulfurospirillum sp.]|nr:pantetheine-phosphate adenylyltransferase [Sulfurospirillum sp.]
MRRIAIYPGTFDPITNGHLDIIKRALGIFDTLIVAIAVSEFKNPMFNTQCRVEMAKSATEYFKRVIIVPFDGLLVDLCEENGVRTLVRGLRAVSDFEYELQMGYANASLNKEIETVYLMPSLENAFISSTVVREVIRHKGNFSHLVPPSTVKILKEQLCTSSLKA